MSGYIISSTDDAVAKDDATPAVKCNGRNCSKSDTDFPPRDGAKDCGGRVQAFVYGVCNRDGQNYAAVFQRMLIYTDLFLRPHTDS